MGLVQVLSRGQSPETYNETGLLNIAGEASVLREEAIAYT
jgi:hypothetical protein